VYGGDGWVPLHDPQHNHNRTAARKKRRAFERNVLDHVGRVAAEAVEDIVVVLELLHGVVQRGDVVDDVRDVQVAKLLGAVVLGLRTRGGVRRVWMEKRRAGEARRGGRRGAGRGEGRLMERLDSHDLARRMGEAWSERATGGDERGKVRARGGGMGRHRRVSRVRSSSRGRGPPRRPRRAHTPAHAAQRPATHAVLEVEVLQAVKVLAGDARIVRVPIAQDFEERRHRRHHLQPLRRLRDRPVHGQRLQLAPHRLQQLGPISVVLLHAPRPVRILQPAPRLSASPQPSRQHRNARNQQRAHISSAP
jgi:hypothetical protein